MEIQRLSNLSPSHQEFAIKDGILLRLTAGSSTWSEVIIAADAARFDREVFDACSEADKQFGTQFVLAWNTAVRLEKETEADRLRSLNPEEYGNNGIRLPMIQPVQGFEIYALEGKDLICRGFHRGWDEDWTQVHLSHCAAEGYMDVFEACQIIDAEFGTDFESAWNKERAEWDRNCSEKEIAVCE